MCSLSLWQINKIFLKKKINKIGTMRMKRKGHFEMLKDLITDASVKRQGLRS